MAGPDQRPPEDLGLGRSVAQATRGRLLSRDGRFLIRRTGLGFFESWSAYHWIIGLRWSRFLFLLVAAFLSVNLVFAALFTALGPGALSVAPDDPLRNPFLQAFFFSVQTLATIGYGHISPRGLPANLRDRYRGTREQRRDRRPRCARRSVRCPPAVVPCGRSLRGFIYFK